MVWFDDMIDNIVKSPRTKRKTGNRKDKNKRNSHSSTKIHLKKSKKLFAK